MILKFLPMYTGRMKPASSITHRPVKRVNSLFMEKRGFKGEQAYYYGCFTNII